MKLSFYPKDFILMIDREIDPMMTAQEGGSFEYDFLLRGLFIHNSGRNPATIESINITVCCRKSRPVRETVYQGKALTSRLLLAEDQYHRCQGPLFPFVFGGDSPAMDHVAIPGSDDTFVLKPGQSTCLLFEHQRVPSAEPPDTCRVRVAYKYDCRHHHERICEGMVMLKSYRPENELLFPVVGSWLLMSAYDNVNVASHRRLQSQEYALDMVQLGSDHAYQPAGRENMDYACYGRSVHAVADGEVVTVHDGYPDNPCGHGASMTEEERSILLPRHGMLAVLVGNHVVIRHAGSEHSMYVHLRPSSICVSRGAHVSAGQPIGEVGNSGFSGGPHLHFALMDGPDAVTARGLPCRFQNIRNLIWGGEERRVLESHWLVEAS